MSSAGSSAGMAEQAEEKKVEFKSDCGRILRTEALNMIDMITVTVGTGAEAVKFPVLEALARRSSPFFDNAMKPEWASSKPDPRNIELPEQDPELFKIYLHWLYLSKLPTVQADNEDKQSNTEWVLLSKSYVLGEQIMDIGFKNAILDALVDAKKNTPDYVPRNPGESSINVVYAGTPEGSPARRLLVDIWVQSAGENWTKYLTNTLPHAFVLEFSRALLKDKCKGKKDTQVWKVRAKDYHET